MIIGANFIFDGVRYQLLKYPLGLQGRKFPYHVKNTADHWWPNGLQRLWADDAGNVSLIKPSGEIESKKPPKRGSGKKGFAYTQGGHRVCRVPSPWNRTFEPGFQNIDNIGPPIVKSIKMKLESKDYDLGSILQLPDTTDSLIKLCFSLLIRSPAFRDRYSYAGARFGLGFNAETGKANIEGFWGSAKNIDLKNCNSSKIILLHSKNSEFLFGDGLFDTIFTRPIGWRLLRSKWVADLTGQCLVPLLPNVCAYIFFDRGGCGAKIYMANITCKTVSEINELTQIYSKEKLFFRSFIPALSPDYRRCEHMRVLQMHTSLFATLQALISSE